MGKVWFTLGLFAWGYNTARIVTNGMDKSLYCAATSHFLLTGGYMDPDPAPLLNGRAISFR
ncbi:hypothetical protein ENTCAN_09514 [Enterobacter cancerogenus ATCC 35316]|nr:hypothetical protein ENTCAN_09514 [Enterobacter cancerogenus ATCC 35316]